MVRHGTETGKQSNLFFIPALNLNIPLVRVFKGSNMTEKKKGFTPLGICQPQYSCLEHKA